MGELSIYQSIALDMAQRIANGEFAVGDKIAGRSLLASHYHVSPETIRKAIGILKNDGVVEVSQGREITIISVEKAYLFVEKSEYIRSVYSLKQDVEQLLQEKKKIDKKLDSVLNDIINFSDRLKNLSPYNPVEVTVPVKSWVIGKTIADLQLWQQTGATMVAIRRGNQIIISPGPQVILQANDRVVVVGGGDVLEETTKFFHRKK